MIGQLSSFSSSSHHTNLQWSEVLVDSLKQMSPDVCEYLARAPAKWSARDLSRFCTDRDDWGVLVSMFACLWGAVTKAKAYQGQRDALTRLAASDQFRCAAQYHIQKHGVAAHVLMLVKQFGPVNTWPVSGERPGVGVETGQEPMPRRRATEHSPRLAGPRRANSG